MENRFKLFKPFGGNANKGFTVKKSKSNPSETLQTLRAHLAADRERLRAKLDSYEHWVVIFDREGERAIHQMQRRFYRAAGADDFEIFDVEWAVRPLGIAVARKRRMLRRELAKLLRRYSPADLAVRARDGCDVLLLTAPSNIETARRLGIELLNSPAPEETPMRFSSRLAKLELIERAKLDAEIDAVFDGWLASLSEHDRQTLGDLGQSESFAEIEGLTDEEVEALDAQERRRESLAEKRARLADLREFIKEQQQFLANEGR